MSRRFLGKRTVAAPDASARVAPVLLRKISSPQDLRSMSNADLEELAREIRSEICRLSETRSIHFASNLGVVELTIALHYCFDFLWDRLVWDVGHQCYPHKMLTGRFGQFDTLRTHGGLSGYPCPEESAYDLFKTGHAGCSVGTALGLSLGDSLVAERQNALERRRERISVAVVGDGAFSSGPVFEALNHAGDLHKKLIVVLNDNEMSICPRVGGFGRYLDQIRMAPGYLGTKTWLHRYFDRLPSAHNFLSRFKDALRTGLVGGAFFEDLGFHYVGPINGHDIPSLIDYFETVKTFEGPVFLHVMTIKGHGYAPAENDPSHFHSSRPHSNDFAQKRASKIASRSSNAETRQNAKKALERDANSRVFDRSPDSEQFDVRVADVEQSFTFWAQTAIMRLMRENPRVCVVVAAMTQGNMLENARRDFPERFFDVGISEAHAVNFAAGLAKAGMRPIVDIYSGFLQRAYDHLFQETSLQNLPIVFSLDRAGFVGADGPTHHGVFDLSYLRPFPNMTVVAPGDSSDMTLAFDFALQQDGPVAIRYPKTKAGRIERKGDVAPFELGRAERVREGTDGAILACGGELCQTALDAARAIAQGEVVGVPKLDVAVYNARFAKPVDVEMVRETLGRSLPVVTLEENAAPGGFGAAVLEIANDEGLDARPLVRLNAPDRYLPHGSRADELKEAGLDLEGTLRAFAQSWNRSLNVKK